MTDHQPLTLERWAALDQAASPGPWSFDYDNDVGPDDDYFVQFYTVRNANGEVLRTDTYSDRFVQSEDQREGPIRERDAQFVAATKGSAPALLRGLLALPTYEAVIRDHGDLEEVVSLSELRHLIATLDLSAHA